MADSVSSRSELIQGLHYAFGIDPRGMATGGLAVKKILVDLAGAAKHPAVALTAIGAAGAIAFVKAAKSAAEFETALAEVMTITEATREEVQALGRDILKLSQSVPQSAVQLTKGYYEVLSAGVTDSADAMKVLEASAKLAAAGLTDTAVTVDAITTTLNAYGLSADHASRISDIMFETVRLGKVRTEELAHTIGVAIPFAAELGVSFEELGAAIAVMTGAGVDVELTVTSLKNLMAELLKPSKDAIEMAGQLGIEFTATAMKAKGLAGFLEDLRVKTEGNREALSRLYPDIRGLLAALSLTGEQWSKFDGYLQQTMESYGATDRAAAQMNITLDKQADLIRNKVHAWWVNLGNVPGGPLAQAKNLMLGLNYLFGDAFADAALTADRALAMHEDQVEGTRVAYEAFSKAVVEAQKELAGARARSAESRVSAGERGDVWQDTRPKNAVELAVDQARLRDANMQYARSVDEMLARELAHRMAQVDLIEDTEKATEARNAAVDAIKLHAFQIGMETGYMADLAAITGKYTQALGAKTAAEIAATQASGTIDPRTMVRPRRGSLGIGFPTGVTDAELGADPEATARLTRSWSGMFPGGGGLNELTADDALPKANHLLSTLTGTMLGFSRSLEDTSPTAGAFLSGFVSDLGAMSQSGTKITASGLLSSAGWSAAAAGAGFLVGKLFGLGDGAKKAAERAKQMQEALRGVSEAMRRMSEESVTRATADLHRAEAMRDTLRGLLSAYIEAAYGGGTISGSEVMRQYQELRQEVETLFGISLPADLRDALKVFDEFIDGIEDRLDETQKSSDSFAASMDLLNDILDFKDIDDPAKRLEEFRRRIYADFGFSLRGLVKGGREKWGDRGDTPEEFIAMVRQQIGSGMSLNQIAQQFPQLGAFSSLDELKSFLRTWEDFLDGLEEAVPSAGEAWSRSTVSTITTGQADEMLFKVDTGFTRIGDAMQELLKWMRGEYGPHQVFVVGGVLSGAGGEGGDSFSGSRPYSRESRALGVRR